MITLCYGLRRGAWLGLLWLGGCASGVGVQQGLPGEQRASIRQEDSTTTVKVQPLFRVEGQWVHPQDDASRLNRAGLVDWRSGDRPRAIERWQRAAQIAPQDAAVQNNLGYALMTMGELEQAWPALRAAFAADPNNLKTRANIQAFGRAWRARCAERGDCHGRIAPSAAAISSGRHVDSVSHQPIQAD